MIPDSIPSALWKLTIDPRGKTDPTADSFDFCQRKGIVGIGWWLSARPDSKSEAMRLLRMRPDEPVGPLNLMANRMQIGDHVWVYGKGKHYLCRVTSDWIYEDGGEWDAHDIHNFREAEWKHIPAPLVPGAVKRSLTMRGSTQVITSSPEVRAYSGWLAMNTLAPTTLRNGVDATSLRKALVAADPSEVWPMLDPDETEDVAGLLVQSLGWMMVKSSTYRSQRKVECTFQRATTAGPEEACMQVKSGGVPILVSEYLQEAVEGRHVYLFSTAKHPYPDEGTSSHPMITLIAGREMKEFVADNVFLLPWPVLLKLAIRFDALQ